MRAVSPKVFLIQRPSLIEAEVAEWLNHIGAVGYQLPETTGAEGAVMLAGKRCYMAFGTGLNKNLTKTRENVRDYIENILKVGHGSVLAHCHFTFAIEGISRVGTAELNRHRIGAHRDELPDEPDISEGSMRFIRFDDIPYTMPNCLKPDPNDDPETALLKTKTIEEFDAAFAEDEGRYERLEKLWAKKLAGDTPMPVKKAVTSLMRRIIGIGVASGGTWTYSLRALRSMFELRCAPEAEEEILDIGVQMLEKMLDFEPNFFRDFQRDDKGFFRPKFHKV